MIGAAEGMKEDNASWLDFLRSLKLHGLKGNRLFIGDKCLGLLEAVNEVYPASKYQRCTVYFYQNVFSVTPRSKKAIHAQEDKEELKKKLQQ